MHSFRSIVLFLWCLTSTSFLFTAAGSHLGYLFTRVKAQGSLLGKDRFLHHYRIAPGEPFDEEKHTHSLAKIRAELKDEGYLNAKIIDTIQYHDKSKTVSVSLLFQEGNRFAIDRIIVQLVGGGAQAEEITQGLQSLLESSLLRAYFLKELVDKEAGEIKAWLSKRGYNQPHLSLATAPDSSGKVTLTFTVTLGPQKQLVFVGNTFFKSEELFTELSSLDGDGVPLPPSLVAEDIETLYKRKGFFEAEVTARDQGQLIKFVIKEGPRAHPWMKGVKLSFQEARPDDKQVAAVLTKLVALISGYASYDADEVNRRVEKATQKIRELGYWDAVITFAQPERVAYFPLLVRLGGRRSAQAVAIEGYPDLQAAIQREELFSPWKNLPEPRGVSPKVVEEQRCWLENYLKQRGFLYANAQETFRLSELGITLIWKIDTKKGPVRFGPTTIVGLQRMKQGIVYRELAYAVGDVWQREKIEKTAKRLKCLGMFESVSIGPDTAGMAPGVSVTEQPMRITCIEDDPYEIRTRFGLQFVSKSFTRLSWTTYKIGGSFIWKNPAGIADTLSLDADLTRYSRNLAASYEVPWIGPLPIRTQMRVYSDRFDEPFFESSGKRLYKEEHDGASVMFHHSHEYWDSTIKMGFEVNKLFGISHELARVIQFEPRLVDRSIPYLYFEPVVTFERIDNKADPCKGIYTSLSCKAMVPPGVRDGWFIRALIEQSLFYPLYRSVIGAIRWRFGHIFNAQFSTILPTERFYLGGASSLRGYETNMVPPLNDFICDGNRVWVPVGGKSMGNINAEIRFPIYRWIRGVVFTDIGVLTQDKFADIAANRWLGATGFGLRITTPVGPVRFDIGWKWKKREPNDRRYAWFLTFGHAF